MGDAPPGDVVGSALPDDFTAAVGSLNGGELMFPPPFDLASSVALDANTDDGDLALGLFDGTANTRSLGFRLRVEQVLLDTPDGPVREVIDIVVTDVRQAKALIGILAREVTISPERLPLHQPERRVNRE
jgi:hypothetical protein